MTVSSADDLRALIREVPDFPKPGILLGAYLYGSAVAEGLQPDSDLDVLGVVTRRLTAGERRAVIDGLLPISGRSARPAAWRPVEVTLVVADEVRPWRYPPRFDLQYGEWLREEAIDSTLEEPVARPDVAILITMVRDGGRSLLGPLPQTLFAPVPPHDLARAVLDELQPVLDDLETDTRNVLLTLARMWCTVATGEIRSKAAAAMWALRSLPEAHRPVLERARAAYLGDESDSSYDEAEARSVAEAMAQEIRRGSR